ncbi:hypothetical protein ACBJ59_45215 [Nonomuraea sp. MTCD27]|uniref:hypothetical protein n=1 Tax=Nonomuraea sp. MTCD27 TaxID=1676747 RepID=UPI0035BFF067
MRHTESGLGRLLDERSRERAGGEPAADLDAIVRRGRRIRRTRRAVTAGAALALAVSAAGLANTLLVGPRAADQAMVAQRSADSARVEPELKIPEEFKVVLGATKFDLSLIHSERFGTMGAARTVTYTPTSHFTGYKVVCDDPRAWVVTKQRLKGGEMGGGAARCGSSPAGHHDERSTPDGWLERPQSLQVWVFPADAPVLEMAQAADITCPSFVKSREECDERAALVALRRAGVLERLSAQVGERPGRWAVGIYDRAAAAPDDGPAGADPTPSGGSSEGSDPVPDGTR